VIVDSLRSESYRSWLLGELLLVALLGAATALFVTTRRLDGYLVPHARIALDSAVTVFALIVAILTAVRFRVEGRAMDMLLAGGFVVAGLGSFTFRVAPTLGGSSVPPEEAWAGLAVSIVAASAIAAAPYVSARIGARDRALVLTGATGALAMAVIWLAIRLRGVNEVLPAADGEHPFLPTAAFSLLTLLGVVAALGFGLRFRRHGRDLDSWLALAFTLIVFADLHYVLLPALAGDVLLQGDVLRLIAYGVLLAGVWQAISAAEFGRAVAEERARVARDIHDGLAQYLFALSTHVSMLEAGAPLEQLLPRLKEVATAAQQEARFAVLALSSASGKAPFDAALRRYVDLLAADGALEIELELDADVRLAPDEQIEIFRIVQEGLANARRHAGARRAWVAIAQRGGRRVVSVRDDGVGFEGESAHAGQGLRNMRLRAESIDGGFTLRSASGSGTAIEVVLRSA
jgi:signal transduction histidine kinase